MDDQQDDTKAGLARYWPVAAVVVVIAGLIGFNAMRSSDGDDDVATSGDGAVTATADGPPALAALDDEDPMDAPDCDPETGRIKLPSIYAPNCVPIWPDDRDNGGATSAGVTATEITVAVYNAETDAQAQAIVEGATGEATDPDAETRANRDKVVQAHNELFETYGRTVKWVELVASGPADDDAAAKADAIKAATEIKAFAVIGGPTGTNAFADELAARKVICLCTASQPIENYERWAPYVWSGLMASTQGYFHRAQYITERLAGKPAKHAGDPALQSTERSFALVYYETADNAYKAGADYFDETLTEDGITLADKIPYILDLAKAQEDAKTIIARLKEKKVTSVVFAGDPFMPIYLTKEATSQGYRPEWIITGSTATDTTTMARQYDQEQWAHAFGISFLLARVDPDYTQQEPNYVAWHLGEELTSYPGLTEWGRLFTGIHLAGPDLTPETFRDGLFAFKPVKDHVTGFAVSYGNDLWPWPDYLAADDVTEIWWDPDAEGPQENGKEGKGMYRYVAMGKRYLPGELPATEPAVFDEADTVLVYDERPEADRPPEYPRRSGRED
jgi:hypothetical protein